MLEIIASLIQRLFVLGVVAGLGINIYFGTYLLLSPEGNSHDIALHFGVASFALGVIILIAGRRCYDDKDCCCNKRHE